MDEHLTEARLQGVKQGPCYGTSSGVQRIKSTITKVDALLTLALKLVAAPGWAGVYTGGGGSMRCESGIGP